MVCLCLELDVASEVETAVGALMNAAARSAKRWRSPLSRAIPLRRCGGPADVARELAYRLYAVCERKNWAKEALTYNALVVAWPDIQALAMAPEASDQLTLEPY